VHTDAGADAHTLGRSWTPRSSRGAAPRGRDTVVTPSGATVCRVSSHPLFVRAARPTEAAEIAWLAALTFPLACPPGTPVATMAAHIARHLSPRRVAGWIDDPARETVVALAGPEVVGYALLVHGSPDGEAEADVLREAAGPGPYVELSKIYVHPDRLGDGTAHALLTGALEAGERLAPEASPWLGTNGANHRAQTFYRKHGFEVVGERTYDVGGVQHADVVMLRPPGI